MSEQIVSSIDDLCLRTVSIVTDVFSVFYNERSTKYLHVYPVKTHKDCKFLRKVKEILQNVECKRIGFPLYGNELLHQTKV